MHNDVWHFCSSAPAETAGMPARQRLSGRPVVSARLAMHPGHHAHAWATHCRHPVLARSDLRRCADVYARLAMHTGWLSHSGAATAAVTALLQAETRKVP